MSMEIAVTMRVSMMTAKRPNSPENGFHVEENNRSVRDSFERILKEPLMRTAKSKKKRKMTDAVTRSINLVPNAS